MFPINNITNSALVASKETSGNGVTFKLFPLVVALALPATAQTLLG